MGGVIFLELAIYTFWHFCYFAIFFVLMNEMN